MSSPHRGRPKETARYIKYLLPVDSEGASRSNTNNVDTPTIASGMDGAGAQPKVSKTSKQHGLPARAEATVASAALVAASGSGNAVGQGGTRLAATSSQKEQHQKVKQYIQQQQHHQQQLQQQLQNGILLTSPNTSSPATQLDPPSPDYGLPVRSSDGTPLPDKDLLTSGHLDSSYTGNANASTAGDYALGSSAPGGKVVYGHLREGSVPDGMTSPPPLGYSSISGANTNEILSGKVVPLQGSFALHGSFSGSPPMSTTNTGPSVIVSKKAFKPTAAAAYQRVRELDWRKRERDSTPMHVWDGEDAEEDYHPTGQRPHSAQPMHYTAAFSSRGTSPATSVHHGTLSSKRSFRNTSALRPHEAVEFRKLSIGTDGTFHIGATQYGASEGALLASYPVPALSGSVNSNRPPLGVSPTNMQQPSYGSVPKQRPVYKQVKHRGNKYRKILDAALTAAVDETEAHINRQRRRRQSGGHLGLAEALDETDPIGKEASRRFAEKIAKNPFNPLFTTSHGNTLNLPPVSKSQLPSVLGGAGAVRHKGTQLFSTHLPPPRLVTHQALPIAPKGAIFKASGHPNNKGTANGSAIPNGPEHSPVYSAMAAEMYPPQIELPLSPPTETSGLLAISAHTAQYNSTSILISNVGGEEDEEEEEEEEDDDEYEVIGYTDSAADLMLFVIPAAVNYALSMLLVVLPLGYVGSHLGQHALSATAAGYYFISIVALYPLHGLLFAIDTLCANAYGNDSESNVLGLIFQRGLALALGGLVVVLSILSLAAEPILRLFYNKELAGDILEFVTFSPLYLVCTVIVSAFSKFLSSQMAPSIPMLATVIGVAVTLAWQSHFAARGIRWVAMGMGVATLCQLITIAGVALSRPHIKRTLGTLRLREALQMSDVSSFLQIALPSSLFIALEASAFDVTFLMAAGMGDGPGSAWAALMSYEYLLTFAAAGLSAAACAKVGAAIGANQPINAKTYAWTALFLAAAWGVIFIWPAFITFYRELIGMMGGSLAETRKVYLWYPLLLLLDLIESTCQGIFSGANAYHLGTPLFAAAMWGIGIPLAAILSSGLVLRVANYLNGHGFNKYVMPPKALSEYQSHNQAKKKDDDKSPKGKATPVGKGDVPAPGQQPQLHLTYPPSVVRDYFEQNTHSPIVASFEPFIGIRGLGVGFTLGLLVLCVLLLRAVIQMDWDGLAFQSQVEDEEEDEDEEDEELEEEEDEEMESEDETSPDPFASEANSPLRGYHSHHYQGPPQPRNIISVRK